MIQDFQFKSTIEKESKIACNHEIDYQFARNYNIFFILS